MNRLSFLAFAGLALWPGAVSAAGDTIVTEAGRQLARQWCAECHMVEADQSYALSAAAPSFMDVADDPATTETALKAFLITPHQNMPNIMLTNQQTEEIVAYILSLRGQ